MMNRTKAISWGVASAYLLTTTWASYAAAGDEEQADQARHATGIVLAGLTTSGVSITAGGVQYVETPVVNTVTGDELHGLTVREPVYADHAPGAYYEMPPVSRS